jgi:hypothetical protein
MTNTQSEDVMNEYEALRYAANMLRTLSGMDNRTGTGLDQQLLYAARVLDQYNERPPSVPADHPLWPWEREAAERQRRGLPA